jgi:hypothetical protein
MNYNVWYYLRYSFKIRAQRICGDVFVLMTSGLMQFPANENDYATN